MKYYFIEKGIRNLNQAVEIVKIPIADGGEGTVESLVLGCNGEYQYLEVVGPAGNKIKAKYGFVNRDIAIIEMAQASGLHIIKDRNKK